MRKLFICFLAILLISITFSRCFDLAFDIPYNAKPLNEDYACLAEKGYYTGVIEGLKSNGNCALDAEYKLNFCNQHQSRCDLSFDLDLDKDPVKQIDDAFDCLKGLNVQNYKFNKLWIIVELGRQANGEWPISNDSDRSSNVEFISNVLDTIANYLEVNRIGFETNESDWNRITGGSTIGIGFDLYYHGNYQQSFEDFTPFGGWTFSQVEMKKYATSKDICQESFDLAIIQ
ncbi:lysozyme protein [Anaeramoeba flamelloides]|uniref:Lysozyme protein n=1 Tax=Anaeramoeba flamelloides TaxID=1746091 RepID=A0AAV7YIW4_9EUKA|nr:lysozyme protein [Anaeramoeba flamelloides]